jgi:Uma2 family endonuclease
VATAIRLTPQDYLRLAKGSDRPDVEYVRGEIVERSMPDLVHSGVQKRLIVTFSAMEDRHRLYAFPELRLRLAEDVFRVPDVTVFAGQPPSQLVPDRPPACVIEIVSRDDRYTELLQKLDEYHRWGVPHIWVVDPWLERLSAYDGGDLLQAPELGLPGMDRRLTIGELIRGLKDAVTS